MENKYNLSHLKSCDQVWEDMLLPENQVFGLS